MYICYRPHSEGMGKVMFSPVSVCLSTPGGGRGTSISGQDWGRGYPHSADKGYPHPADRDTPTCLGPRSGLRGYPPISRTEDGGTPPPRPNSRSRQWLYPQPEQHNVYLLRGWRDVRQGWYSACSLHLNVTRAHKTNSPEAEALN